MKISKGEITLLAGTVAIVALVLLGGVWGSQRNAAILTSMMAGRYSLVYDRNINGRVVSKVLDKTSVELRADSQWLMFIGPTLRRQGNYTIVGSEIIFTGHLVDPNPSQIKTHTGRLTRDGFAMTANPFIVIDTPIKNKNLRYSKVSRR